MMLRNPVQRPGGSPAAAVAAAAIASIGTPTAVANVPTAAPIA